MTQTAQASRAFIEAALAMQDAVSGAGVTDPAQASRLLHLGAAVASFIGHQPAPALGAPQFAKVMEGDKHIITVDTANRLAWDISDFGGKRMTFEQAQKACAALRTGGHSDWRLPTVRELLTLVDYERSDPAIDKDFFPNCESSYYRTSTPYQPASGCAWVVYFYGGNSYSVRHDSVFFVRAVRASQF